VEIQRKPTSRGESATNVNGKQTAKGKGKEKAAPRKGTRKLASASEPMDVDPIVIDEDERGQGPSMMAAMDPYGKNKRSTLPTSRSTKNGEASGIADQLRRVSTCVT
jgi:hypothetical protein